MFGFNYVEGGPWSDDGIKSIDKFYQRVGRTVDLISEEDTRYPEIDKVLNNTIKSINEDIERFQFNTCIARIMEYVNSLSKLDKIPRYYIEKLLLVLAPFAPHISEELWNKIGNEFSIHNQKYPEVDTNVKEEDSFEVVVQINGKVRGKVTITSDMSEEDVKNAAKEIDNVKRYLEGSEIVKEIYIPKK
jgi:leucyl-tRNA synthetase